nr:unnamed protein product [Spirometra erinaceieuropaei]
MPFKRPRHILRGIAGQNGLQHIHWTERSYCALPFCTSHQTFSFLDSKPFYHTTDAKKSTRTVKCAIKVPKDPLALKLSIFVDGVIQCSLSLQKAEPCGNIVYVPSLEMIYALVTVRNRASKLGSLHSVICKIKGAYGEKYLSHYVSFGSNPYIA